MSSGAVQGSLRAIVSSRANGCCEYCKLHEEDGNLPHELDHIIAEQHGGETTPDNLAFACFHCNRLKGPNFSSIDPETKAVTPLFHPRHDLWTEHFRLEGARIIGCTAIGRATLTLLRLNSDERLAPRETLLAASRYPRP